MIGVSGTQRRPERPQPVRLQPPQHDHAGRHQHEGEQRADVGEVHHLGDVGERREGGHEQAGDDGADVGRLEPRVHPRQERRQQAVARHRHEDARLAQLEHQQHAAHGDHRAERDDEPRDRRAAWASRRPARAP